MSRVLLLRGEKWDLIFLPLLGLTNKHNDWQLRAAKIRSNYLHSITGWTKSSMTEWGRGGGRSRMIGRSLSAGGSTLFVRGNRDKVCQLLGRGCDRERTCCSDAKTPGSRPQKEWMFWDSSRRDKRCWNWRRNSGEERKESLDRG